MTVIGLDIEKWVQRATTQFESYQKWNDAINESQHLDTDRTRHITGNLRRVGISDFMFVSRVCEP
jgi:hypothetical protein